MIGVSVLVVAKAPVPGLAKTRLAAGVGDGTAADIAAAALLDTLDAVADSPVAARVVALTGNLDDASCAGEIRSRLNDFIVIAQRGEGFADRLANAHLDAAAATGGLPVLQIGMDTPQVTPSSSGGARSRSPTTTPFLAWRATAAGGCSASPTPPPPTVCGRYRCRPPTPAL